MLRLQNHLVKLHPRQEIEVKLSPAESLLYRLSPSDSLISKADLVFKYVQAVRHDKDYRNFTIRPIDIEAALKNLVDKGFLKDVNSTRLERWLDTF